MPSPEHRFQPPIVFAPDNKTGGIPNATQLERPQHLPLTETASQTNQYLEVLKLYASAVLGLTPEPVRPVLESNPSLLIGWSVTIDPELIRRKRREHFEQTGEFSRAIGGQDRKKSSESSPQPDLKRYPQTGGYPPSSEEYRQFRARELGLPENASWGEIGDFLNQQDLLAIAREMGFSEKQTERVSWYAILTEGVLGLGGNEPIEKVIQKIKNVKEILKRTEEDV